MKSWWKILSLSALFALGIAQADVKRIVTLSPDVVDIVVELDGTERIVGKDSTNRNPALKDVASVGVHRNLTVEPIVALEPDLVVGSYMVLPNNIFDKLSALGVNAVNVAPDESLESYVHSIEKLGELLGKTEKAKALSQQWQQGMQALPETGKRYLLSYDGRIVAGRGTVGDTFIKLAGGINAADVDGLKPLSREGWLAANPDVIIIAEHHKSALGEIEVVKQREEIAQSPAAQNNQVHYWPANSFLRYELKSPEVVKQLHDLAQ
ncbi:MAG: ABC transporter substrate-binding protein [Cardiobacteriaceae bacterium]|nr:ABC transporter substrate-binding protein [Cardiobacteriaceae bacterium]